VVPKAPESPPDLDIHRVTRDVVAYTAMIETVAAAVLFLAFLPSMGTADAAWHGIFHAVSAFCNAGFSTFSDSLEGWTTHRLVLWPVMPLVVLGGIGFLTFEERDAQRRTFRTEDRFRLSLRTRTALAGTAFLLLAGWGLLAAFEWHGVLAAGAVASPGCHLRDVPSGAVPGTSEAARCSRPPASTLGRPPRGGSPGKPRQPARFRLFLRKSIMIYWPRVRVLVK